MSSILAQVSRGPKKRPHFILLYGVDGIGKTSFAASAPNPVFLGTDDGFATLDVASLPPPATWEELKAQIQTLLTEKHDFETAIFDTVNGLEVLLFNFLMRQDGVSTIEDVGGGFGKGYVQAAEHWSVLLADLKKLRLKMNVILLGHALIKPFEDPEKGQKYDRYILKMHEKSAALIREAADCVFFANYETRTSIGKNDKKAKAFGDGSRKLYTERRPAFDAKNRFNLPFEMDLSWKEFSEAAAAVVTVVSEDAMNTLFKGVEEKALAYLISIKWLLEGQQLSDLLAAKRKTILSRPEDFLKAVSSYNPEPESADV